MKYYKLSHLSPEEDKNVHFHCANSTLYTGNFSNCIRQKAEIRGTNALEKKQKSLFARLLGICTHSYASKCVGMVLKDRCQIVIDVFIRGGREIGK